ncbi:MULTISPECIES: MgtC/SapB family protein [Achromobacter]|jgi:putative Mg2+ transporter-C (MgtC) family protein|uniref:Protein MgtC n=1 Tax=Achromobacter aegrifaciens TaxID=1287736 RepID=A0AAD2J1I4_ACHAE|nr:MULTISPECIES: MgtC/SapB family protein [Achromobacter]PTN50256.1 methyltransferase [Achromobacter xylosoxidans]MBD9380949.1 MgtC/SapB family protein [Achromobacter sp. ACM02]MBD9419316.1 MgtC/SapB family protein [Achromobacter sp. ACM04]MDQ1762603.1 MgtC/SapB family protein [Achromobacter aegrifaciens]RIJ05769.1 MgtC/SapB family protein [Achromobacter sp. K91]
MNEFSIAINLVLAMLLGAAIGAERQWRQNYAGVVTHALVSLGAAAYTALPALLDAGNDMRLGSQVVTGIGFLGAGLIMRDGLTIRGLSAAATIWATGAVGVLAGYGFQAEASAVTALILVTNVLLRRGARLMDRYVPDAETEERYYNIALTCASTDEAMVRAELLNALGKHSLRLRGVESQQRDGGRSEVTAVVYSMRQEDERVEQLVGSLSLLPQTYSARWTSDTGNA